MKHLIGKRLVYRHDHRLFDSFWSLLQLLGGMAVSQTYTNIGKIVDEATEGIEGIYYSPHFETGCTLPLNRVVEHTCRNIIPFSIEFTVRPLHSDMRALLPKDGRPSDTQSSRLNDLCAAIVFVNFFERYRGLIEATWGDQLGKWPRVFNFARVIRNAAAHSGRIHFDRVITYNVRWRGLVYAYAHNHHQVIGRDMYAADLIYLMIDMARQLDARKVLIIR